MNEKTILSTKIQVLVDGKVIGQVQTINVDDSDRSIKMIDEPVKPIMVTAIRTRFDKNRIAEVFSRGFVGVQSQRMPLQIEIEDKFIDAEPIVTKLKNCWIERAGFTYTTADYVIAENVKMQAEEVVSEPLKRENIFQKAVREIQEEEDRLFLDYLDNFETCVAGKWHDAKRIDSIDAEIEKSRGEIKAEEIYASLGVDLAKPVVLAKGRSVGKSTEVGANVINEMRDAIFAVEKELGVKPSPIAGKAKVINRDDFRHISISIVDEPVDPRCAVKSTSVRWLTSRPDGVTCKKCNDFNEYCDTPSELNGTHICYKCKKGY